MNSIEKDIEYMCTALREAEKAASGADIPVGAVIIDPDGNVLSARHNEREAAGSAVAHAEILCIEDACKKRGGWRLSGCTMFVTLEPCPMCAGALINSRIDRVVCGVKNPKSGAFGSVLDLNSYPLNHRCKAEFGVMEKECSNLLSAFFENKRSLDVEKINKP